MNSPALLECRDVSAGYVTASGTRVLFSGLDFRFERGQRMHVVGRSGSGKSTLLRLLNRFAEPLSGEIRVAGRPLPAHDVLEVRRRVCLVLQQPVMFETSVIGNLLEHSRSAPAPDPRRARELLLELGIGSQLHDQSARELSGGEMQRVALARALLRNPELLLLDEPSTALDPATSLALARLLSELQEQSGFGLIVVSHDADFMRALPGNILGLAAGRVRLGLDSSGLASLLHSSE